MQREATIEEKIWIRKKEKVKRRGEMNRRMEQGQPKKKKLRLEEGLKTSEEKRQTENEPSILIHQDIFTFLLILVLCLGHT